MALVVEVKEVGGSGGIDTLKTKHVGEGRFTVNPSTIPSGFVNLMEDCWEQLNIEQTFGQDAQNDDYSRLNRRQTSKGETKYLY